MTNNSLIDKLYRLNILKRSITVDKESITLEPNPVRSSTITFLTAKLIASGFFVGYVPFAPGTVGSLWIPALYMLLPELWFIHFPLEVSFVLSGVAVILYFLGVWSAGVCEHVWGHDPGRVVIDEIAGMLVTLIFIPLTVKTVWIGFFIFRLCDIFKPQPARWLEKLPHGWGVMSDDVIAGIYANIFLRIGIYLFAVFSS